MLTRDGWIVEPWSDADERAMDRAMEELAPRIAAWTARMNAHPEEGK